jgi:hypothetical protein
MKDGVFFGTSLAVVIAIIAVALSFAESPDIIIQDICENGYELKGDDLNRLVQVDGTNISFTQATSVAPAIMVMDAPLARDVARASAGVFMPITEAYGEIFKGKKVKLTVRARAHRTLPLDEFDAGFFSFQLGVSGWRSFKLSDEFENHSFEMNLKNHEGDLDLSSFGIWPGVKGEGLKMDVSSMRIDIVSDCE